MSRSAPIRRATALIASLVVGVGLLSGCATRAMMAATDSPSPTASESLAPTNSPTPGATNTATPLPVPAPSEPAESEEDGTTVMFITLDLVSGTLEASGMIPDVVEEGGQCTLTLRLGDQTRAVSGATATGPASTYCSLLTIPAADLSPGQWQATLSYRSASHAGTSDSATVSVP